MSHEPKPHRLLPAIVSVVSILLLFTGGQTRPISQARGRDVPEATVGDIMAARRCPCGCGNYLPGSSHEPSCFGCSVGKAEVTRIREGLARGLLPGEIILELGEPVLVNVFADYTHSDLADVWDRAKRIATEFHQHRVVLRPMGSSAEARRATRLVECARTAGYFTRMSDVLIRHDGPWDSKTLIRLATKVGLDPDVVRDCMPTTNISAQVRKNREHAELRHIGSFPTISINGRGLKNNDNAVRRAIHDIIEDDSI